MDIGSVNGRQLSLRLYSPGSMQSYDPIRGFRFAPRKLFSPLAWFRAMRGRWNWDLHWVFHRGVNHRCYCPVGTAFDGRICIAGFGCSWFYSRYVGPDFCPCDEVIEEMKGWD